MATRRRSARTTSSVTSRCSSSSSGPQWQLPTQRSEQQVQPLRKRLPPTLHQLARIPFLSAVASAVQTEWTATSRARSLRGDTKTLGALRCFVASAGTIVLLAS